MVEADRVVGMLSSVKRRLRRLNRLPSARHLPSGREEFTALDPCPNLLMEVRFDEAVAGHC